MSGKKEVLPILKKDPESANKNLKRASIQWNEENLQQNEEEKVPRMKIDEPKTPYNKEYQDSMMQMDDDEPEEQEVSVPFDPEAIAQAAMMRRDIAEDAEDEEEEQEMLERLKHEEFEKKRKQHYNMAELLRKKDWSDDEDEEEEEEQDDDE